MTNLLLILLLVVGCQEEDVYGCTDESACNFDSNATIDNGYCLHPDDLADTPCDCEGTDNQCSCFMLTDLNTTSPTYNTQIGPNTWAGEIRLFYFSSNEQ